MKHSTKLLVIIATLVSTVAFAGVGWAFWSSSGSGSGSGSVGTLSAPTNVHGTSTAGSGTVNLLWNPVSAPNGVSTDLGYWVQHSKDGGAYADACSSTSALPLKPSTVNNCNDAGLTAGSYTYTVTAVFKSWTAQSAPSASPITVTTTGPAVKLAFTQQPSSSTGSVAFGTQPKVTVQDASGNTVTGDSSAVTLSITSLTPTLGGPGTLAGTVTVNASAGVATFSGLSINTAGTGYKLHAADGSLAVTDSNPFNITVGAAGKLAFTQQPAGSTGGVAFTTQPKVTVQDAGGNTVTGDSSAVTLSITSLTPTLGGPGTLAGTVTVNASAGVATFSGLSINTAGTGYKLHAADGSLAVTDSNPFNITVGPAAKFGLTTAAVSGQASNTATLGPITVQAQDLGGNPVNAGAGGIVVTLGSSSTGKIFAASSGGTGVTSVTIPSGSSSKDFFYGDTKAGTPTITASGSLASGTQVETITAASASRLAWTSNTIGTSSCTAGGTSFALAYTICGGSATTFKSKLTLTDGFGNAVANTTGSAISITVAKDLGAFTGSATVTIGVGKSESDGGGNGSVAGEITFTTEGGSWIQDNLTAVANPNPNSYQNATASFRKS